MGQVVIRSLHGTPLPSAAQIARTFATHGRFRFTWGDLPCVVFSERDPAKNPRYGSGGDEAKFLYVIRWDRTCETCPRILFTSNYTCAHAARGVLYYKSRTSLPNGRVTLRQITLQFIGLDVWFPTSPAHQKYMRHVPHSGTKT